ncbi:NAD(P)H-dependent amine dehydrogenase family protein [Actinomadura formosensis]|uniref:NAD(P)H-dependent amine dehydrogenase family protein n=1 Tax=Actinomadura formosensis TaxID=60706 RepID=UPI000830B9EA|nr:hypothetical protein [Actinomadura formosensis]
MTTTPKIAICGLGSIGKAAARLLLDHREGFEIVGAITKEAADQGRRLSEVAGSTTSSDVVVGADLSDLLSGEPDVVLLMTGSFLQDTADDVIQCARAGAGVITPCEELAFPFNRAPETARRIDEAARAGGATVLGTGVNPGFIFDSFLAAASGCSWDVTSIRGRRVVDVAGFGQNIHRRLGIGYTPAEFEKGHADGTIAGHVGFPESIQIVAERLGIPLDGPVQETFVPLVAESPAPTTYGELPAGLTEGFVQRATGMVEGRAMLEFDLVLHLRPRDAAMEPADTFEIDGTHPVKVTLSPGMDAIPATSAQIVNAVPAVLAAEPGLKTVKDLPAAAAWRNLGGGLLR